MTTPSVARLAAAAIVMGAVAAPPRARAAEEAVDLEAVMRIREEGLSGSQVMETVAHLTDVIGARLTGSPAMKEANEWTRDRLQSWGLANARLEPWGPFGLGWSFDRASVHLVAPASAPLIALPRAWTPGTDAPRRAGVVKVKIESESDLDKHRGQLAGKIVLMGEARELVAPEKPLFTRYSEAELTELGRFETTSRRGPFDREALARRRRLQRVLREFFVAEKAVATVEPSPSDAGIVLVGRGGSWVKGENPGVPALVMAPDHYNRLVRLVDRGLPVELELDVRARFHDGDGMAYNTIAEIPGTDRRGEVVMVGAHLDSWHSATGATDNAAGVAVAMEAMRILNGLPAKPRRTIRIALWSGEEQGLLGSRAYVRDHFATRPDPAGAERDQPEPSRAATGPLTLKPEHAKLSAYFNVDNGTGRIRGIYAEKNVAAARAFEAWLGPLRDLGATTVTLRTTSGTDHTPFDSVGLPGFQFIQDQADYSTRTHHTNLDVYDRVQRGDLMQAAVVLASFAWQAANREAMMPRKPLPKDAVAAPSPAPSPKKR